MKTITNGIEVSSRSYYYLLDWSEMNEHEFMYHTFKKIRLSDLTLEEYKAFFKHATESEINNWK